MDVSVSHLCNSSCANYIFPAGKNKKINGGAFVLWHGDARQQNFIQTGQKLLERSLNNSNDPLTEQELKKLVRRKENLLAQDTYYTKIGIDGSIARIGQEIENSEMRTKLWALPVTTMNAFSITNIDAPSNYGTKEYCERWAKKYYQTNGPKCLSLNEEDITNWKNRKIN